QLPCGACQGRLVTHAGLVPQAWGGVRSEASGSQRLLRWLLRLTWARTADTVRAIPPAQPCGFAGASAQNIAGCTRSGGAWPDRKVLMLMMTFSRMSMRTSR